MNRQQRRAQKCQPKRYTEAEFVTELQKSVTKLARQNVCITIAACALALHREFGFDEAHIVQAIEAINAIGQHSLGITELKEQLLAEAGVDLEFLADKAAEGL